MIRQVTTDRESAKKDAEQFLGDVRRQLAKDLRLSISEGGAIRKQVETITRNAKAPTGQTHLRQWEAAFLNTWVPPAIVEVLHQWGVANPRKALLAESHAGLADFSVGTPARLKPFPFQKRMGIKAADIYQRWQGPTGNVFIQPCPDFATLAPQPIVFEGKYFRSGSLEYAQRQLVAAIHETLFYLGVPALSSKVREWNYDYACLIAYDASESGNFRQAWENISKLKDKFWDEANLFVIVLGPGADQ